MTIASIHTDLEQPLPAPRHRSKHSSLLRHPLAAGVVLTFVALALRAPFFGDWNYNVDDQFYALAGQRLLDGATLYVDLWDRKGPVLYLLFAAIAWVSRSPIAYHLTATLFAILGAGGVSHIARRFVGAKGATLAGVVYLALLNQLSGATGQTPVFYNALMVLAASSVLSALPILDRGRISPGLAFGMAAAGLAIGIKQSAAVEALWFGAFVTGRLVLAGPSVIRLLCTLTGFAILGLAPYLLASVWYLHIGEFHAFWHAIVGSSLDRSYQPGWARLLSLVILLGQMLPIGVCAVRGARLLRYDRSRAAQYWFLCGWAFIAVMAMMGYPNINRQYALPLAAPFAILAASYFEHSKLGKLLAAGIVLVSLIMCRSYDLPARWRALDNLDRFTRYVTSQTPRHQLFVWGKPSLIYAQAGSVPPSVLAFPAHFYDGAEAGATGIDEVAELRRILSNKPEAVVYQLGLHDTMTNPANTRQIHAYLHRCAARRAYDFVDDAESYRVIVFSRCNVPPEPPPSALNSPAAFPPLLHETRPF